MNLLKKQFKELQEKSRESKFQKFIELMKPTSKTKILDVGCGPGTFLEEKYTYKKNITGLDINKKSLNQLKKKYPEVSIVHTTALKLPFKDNEFDIVFSNAVIEHVGGWKNQELFAEEIKRVAKKYFVTTPNKHFPFEPHYRMPFYQFVPKSIQRSLSKKIAIGNYKKGEWEDINLLTPKQFQKLFSKAKLEKHKILVYPETLIVYKK